MRTGVGLGARETARRVCGWVTAGSVVRVEMKCVQSGARWEPFPHKCSGTIIKKFQATEMKIVVALKVLTAPWNWTGISTNCLSFIFREHLTMRQQPVCDMGVAGGNGGCVCEQESHQESTGDDLPRTRFGMTNSSTERVMGQHQPKLFSSCSLFSFLPSLPHSYAQERLWAERQQAKWKGVDFH